MVCEMDWRREKLLVDMTVLMRAEMLEVLGYVLV